MHLFRIWYSHVILSHNAALDQIYGCGLDLRVAQVPARDPNKELEATENATDADRLWAGVQTNWLSAIDVSDKIYYVNSARSPDLFWVNLDDLDLNEGTPVKYLDPHDIALGGDVAKRFTVWKAPIP